MKVVLFCGGRGMRLRDYSDAIPKPLVPVGHRPVLWHVMRYYASFGHKDFILCLGYQGEAIKRFFLDYEETSSNDFVLTGGDRSVELLASDIDDWRITFVDTGAASNLGERLTAVRRHLEGEEVFLANYSDGLTDLPLDTYLAEFERSGRIAQFLAIRPPLSYHLVRTDEDGIVTSVDPISNADVWINGGYFAFRREIFDYMRPGEELVLEPFDRLLAERQLVARKYGGFWAPMDTFKDKQTLDDLAAAGKGPWEVWKQQQ